MFGIALLGNRLVQAAAGILLVIAMLFITHCRGREAGEASERGRWEEKVRLDAEAQRTLEQRAEEDRRNQERVATQAAEKRRKEIDDATRNIPDQAPSDRQRTRACIELRRQAAADGRDPPAC